jgi:hypothetical protein
MKKTNSHRDAGIRGNKALLHRSTKRFVGQTRKLIKQICHSRRNARNSLALVGKKTNGRRKTTTITIKPEALPYADSTLLPKRPYPRFAKEFHGEEHSKLCTCKHDQKSIGRTSARQTKKKKKKKKKKKELPWFLPALHRFFLSIPPEFQKDLEELAVRLRSFSLCCGVLWDPQKKNWYSPGRERLLRRHCDVAPASHLACPFPPADTLSKGSDCVQESHWDCFATRTTLLHPLAQS